MRRDCLFEARSGGGEGHTPATHGQEGGLCGTSGETDLGAEMRNDQERERMSENENER